MVFVSFYLKFGEFALRRRKSLKKVRGTPRWVWGGEKAEEAETKQSGAVRSAGSAGGDGPA